MAFSLCFFIILVTTAAVSCQLYIATYQLKPLLATEASIIGYLEQYIAQLFFIKATPEEERTLSLLQKHVDNFRKHDYYILLDSQKYLENPLNAYLIIKRLTRDLTDVLKLLGNDEVPSFYNDKELIFPNEEDLNGVSIAIARLQDVYDLKTPDLAKGELNGVKEAPEFTASDCFELGRQLFESSNVYYSFLWMREALGRLNNNDTKDEDEPKNDRTQISAMSILEYMALSSFYLGNQRLAADISKNLTRLVPSYRSPFEDYEKYVLSFNNSLKGQSSLSFIDGLKFKNSDEHLNNLCRGAVNTSKERGTLKCYHSDNGVAFLKICPFKIEEIHGEPVKILIFHDVLSDKYAEILKGLSTPNLHKNNKIDSMTQYRISKSSHYYKSMDPLFETIEQLVQDISNLNPRGFELLHIANYGVGGQYVPHYDFGGNSDFLGLGRRTATVLFYLSDVAEGGATVFKYLNKVIWPKKGTAIFWYNLLHSGEGNKLTLHGGCPVLQGSKWIAAQWIHEYHQEFIIPCGLKRPPKSLVLLESDSTTSTQGDTN